MLAADDVMLVVQHQAYIGLVLQRGAPAHVRKAHTPRAQALLRHGGDAEHPGSGAQGHLFEILNDADGTFVLGLDLRALHGDLLNIVYDDKDARGAPVEHVLHPFADARDGAGGTACTNKDQP